MMPSTTRFDRCASGPIALVLAGVLVAGCSNSKFEFADVGGRVLLDGEPVNDARIVFMPVAQNEDGEAGPYSQGITDADGNYELRSVEESPRSGAVVGPHRIVVSTKKARLDPNQLDVEIIESPETIPWKYTYYKRTPLTFDVTREGTDSADFALESSAR